MQGSRSSYRVLNWLFAFGAISAIVAARLWYLPSPMHGLARDPAMAVEEAMAVVLVADGIAIGLAIALRSRLLPYLVMATILLAAVLCHFAYNHYVYWQRFDRVGLPI